LAQSSYGKRSSASKTAHAVDVAKKATLLSETTALYYDLYKIYK
jgi:hypothetical protein